MVTDSATVTMQRLPSLFLMVSSLTPYDLPSSQNGGGEVVGGHAGGHMPPIYANGHISATGDPIHFMFGSRVGFSGTADRTALFEQIQDGGRRYLG